MRIVSALHVARLDVRVAERHRGARREVRVPAGDGDPRQALARLAAAGVTLTISGDGVPATNSGRLVACSRSVAASARACP